MRRRPNMADEMLERMRDGRAHDDAILMLTASLEQVRAQLAGEAWQPDLFLAQAELLTDTARCAAMALTLASTSATLIEALAQGLGYDADGLLAGMAQVRPPFPR